MVLPKIVDDILDRPRLLRRDENMFAVLNSEGDRLMGTQLELWKPLVKRILVNGVEREVVGTDGQCLE